MRRLMSGLIITFTAIGASAADEIVCDPAGSQLEMNVCASEEFTAADQALNETYQALLKQQAGDPLFIKKLRNAQKAWLAFRDADIDARFSCAEEAPRICWGSLYPMLLLQRKAELTRERTSHLQQILRDGPGE